MRGRDSGVPDSGWPYGESRNTTRPAAKRAIDAGVPSALRKPLSDCLRRRSISSSLKAGLRRTSERISSAGPIREDSTLVVTDEESQFAPEFKVPPSASIASAICVALLVDVPRVSSDAVISATPAISEGSTSPPLLTTSCAVTRGVSDRCTTITRNPLASIFSTGLGMITERGVCGGGGVAWGTCANEVTLSKAIATLIRNEGAIVFSNNLIGRALPSRR